MIRILYQDIDWTNNDGTIPMSEPMELIVSEGRLVHVYSQPVITNDTFGGRTYPVQSTIFEGYKVQFGTKEIQLSDISKILVSKKIVIYDYETNVWVDVDTQASDLNIIESLERQGVVDHGFVFNFVSKRTCTYPGIARLNTHSIVITINSISYTYYTDLAPIKTISDSERIEYGYNNGKVFVAKTTQKQGYTAVFYLMNDNAVIFKRQLEQTQPGYITINGTVLTEMPVCLLTELTEGLYRCEVQCITENLDPTYA